MRSHIRLTEAREDFSYDLIDVQRALGDLTDEVYKILAVRHRGGKKEVPHFHIIVDYPGTFDLRSWFKEQFSKSSGNKHHMLKDCDESDASLSYLFHENIDDECVVYKWNYSDEDIDRFVSLNQMVQSDMLTPQQVCKKIADDMLKSGKWTHKSILQAIYTHYKKSGKWLPDRRQAERYLHYIVSLMTEDSFDSWYKYYFVA